MLTKEKVQAITLLISGDNKKTDIAEMCGIHRTTLYDWMKDAEFKAEWDRRLREIQAYGDSTIKANLAKSISNIVKIANDEVASDKTRLEANQYLIDRVLWKTTTKIDLEAIA